MPRWASILAALAAAGLLAGGLVLVSGVVPIGASGGHWKITDWVLHFAMRRSVKTHSLGIEVPPLDDPALARRGAGHYAEGCAPCHGAPGLPRSEVALGMTPRPPYLPARIDDWESEELFWIVRHGVKFTGMPAWPALARRDEVWAVVAFLKRLPGLDPEGYRALAFGAAAGTEAVNAPLAACVRCHGRDGAGSGAFPRLAGQSESYLYASLRAYAEGRRFSGMMETAARGLDEAALRALARHYAGQSALSPARPGPASDAGERLARLGDPGSGVPPCASCHGLEEAPRYPAYPTLAGQEAWYIALQLRLLREGERGGSPYARIMQVVAERLSDAQIEAAAAFYASLPAPRP